MSTLILPALLIAVIALLLHWPYRWHRTWDFLGRESGVLHSVLYRYEYGPAHDRLDYDGLRRLLHWLLRIFTDVASQIRPELIMWLVEWFRQAIGL